MGPGHTDQALPGGELSPAHPRGEPGKERTSCTHPLQPCPGSPNPVPLAPTVASCLPQTPQPIRTQSPDPLVSGAGSWASPSQRPCIYRQQKAPARCPTTVNASRGGALPVSSATPDV